MPIMPIETAKRVATDIADRVVPRYRMHGSTVSCTGHIAHQWQAAWDGAIEALGYDNEQFKNAPSTYHG